MEVGDRVDSDHQPLEVEMRGRNNRIEGKRKKNDSKVGQRQRREIS